MNIRNLTGIFLASVSMAVLFGCRMDNLSTVSGLAENEILLSIPAAETVLVKSDASSSECYIENAALFVVSGGTVTGAEYIRTITDNGTTNPKLALAELQPTNGAGIVVVCNFDADAATVEACAGQSLNYAKETILSKSAYTNSTSASLASPLLMYGEGTWGQGEVTMKFQVAKITVENSTGVEIESFFSYASAEHTVWGQGSYTGNLSYVSDAAHAMSSDDAGRIYLYESSTPTSGTYFTSGGPFNCIILEVNNPDTQFEQNETVTVSGGTGYICLTYDTMNDSGTAVSQYQSFQRGYHYNFNITSIYGRGYSTIAEAIANPGNATYTVEVNDDWSTDTKYNGQYAVVTAVDTVYMVYPTTSATDLVQIGTYLPSGNSGTNITTRRVSLVRVNAGTSEYETVPVAQARLIDADGNYANNNSITLPATIDSDGYMLRYVTGNDIVEGMYLRLEYGNMEEFIILPSVNYEVNVGDIYAAGGTLEVNVTRREWFPGKNMTEDPDYGDYTITFVDDAGNETDVDWADVDDDGNLTIDGNGVQFKDKVSGTVDLSYYNGFDTGTQTTANCYIVNASGNYKFPLVYGNAIKNGETNSAAYTKQANNVTGIDDFVDHNDNVISNPYITNRYNPTDAIIVWQDQEDMITDVGLSDNNTYMTFTVRDNLTQGGNAVLAVRNGSTILWSWHIWVTTYDPWGDAVEGSVETGTKEVINYDNVTFYIMYCYLGACSASDFPERSTTVQITPTDNPGAEITVTITQAGTSSVGDNCYYQSGRKDPFPGIQGGRSGSDKQTYGTYAWSNGVTKSSAMSSVGTQIRLPYTLSSTGTNATRAYNQWNAARTSYRITSGSSYVDNGVVVKTVYDPSPVDFCVPPNGMFSAFFTSKPTSANATLNCGVSSTTAENLTITLPDNSTYNFQIVPYRRGSDGGIYTSAAYTIFTATPLMAMSNTAYIYSAIACTSTTNYTSVNLTWANSTVNARAIIPAREPSSRSTGGNWLYD